MDKKSTKYNSKRLNHEARQIVQECQENKELQDEIDEIEQPIGHKNKRQRCDQDVDDGPKTHQDDDKIDTSRCDKAEGKHGSPLDADEITGRSSEYEKQRRRQEYHARNFYVLDVKTTGSYDNEPVCIAGVMFKDGEPQRPFNQFLRPYESITPRAFMRHGMSMAFLQNEGA